ncbi:MAG: DUF1638 domain-containing protein [Geobacteraceae bacterium]|jgi:hypothetical protein
MKSVSQPKTVMICCSVLQAEVESLCQAHWPDHQLRFLPSMMHMHPDRLASSLESILDEELKEGHGAVLIYGDCCASMTVLEALPGVARTRGKNCCELLLGPEEYRRLSHEGAFFLIPEWAHRWKEIFAKELGLNNDNATSLMREIHRKLMYLDTGLAPVPENALKECAEYCGLPCEVRPVSLERLRQAIEEAMLRTGAPI